MLTPRVWLILGLALALRAALFPFAENKHGDAPMRALIAERMVLDPASAADPRTYCQFGPLHTALMRPFVAADPLAPRSTRYLSLLAGIAVFFPFLALAEQLVGRPRAALAAFALAVSPLHLQASTTASSEALYLLLFVGALERLLAGLDGEVAGSSPPSRRSRATMPGWRCRFWCWPRRCSGPRRFARLSVSWRCSPPRPRSAP